MDEELTIQQAAGQTGLSVHTLRYYERIGLSLLCVVRLMATADTQNKM